MKRHGTSGHQEKPKKDSKAEEGTPHEHFDEDDDREEADETLDPDTAIANKKDEIITGLRNFKKQKLVTLAPVYALLEELDGMENQGIIDDNVTE